MVFNVLYYPFVRFPKIDILKKTALYFDTIHIIRPSSVEVRSNTVEGYLHQEGIIKYIDPKDNIGTYPEMFDRLVESDYHYFSSIYRNYTNANDYWIYRDKASHRHQKKFFDNFSGCTEHPFRRGLHRMSYPYGISLLLNHVYLSSMQMNLSPITNDIPHDFLLKAKLEKVASDINNPRLRATLDKYDITVRKDVFAQKIINQTLPTVGNLSVSKIMEIRDDHKKELSRFRNHVSKLSASISVNYWNLDLDSQMQKIIDYELIPSIDDLKISLENEKTELKAKFGKRFVIGGMSLAGTLLCGGFSSIPIVTLVSVLIGSGLSAKQVAATVNDYIDYLKTKRKINNSNAVSYLFKFK